MGKERPSRKPCALSDRNVRFWHSGDIHAARFNVWFRALFGHQRVALLCRRLTQSGNPGRCQVGTVLLPLPLTAPSML